MYVTLNLGDYQADIQGLSGDERGVYMSIAN
jgi:uncharacterized protein YdaU (DUF1376 family)